jgi:hypothetical protein
MRDEPQLPRLPRLDSVPDEIHNAMVTLAAFAWFVSDRHDICPICLVNYLSAVIDKSVEVGIFEHAADTKTTH